MLNDFITKEERYFNVMGATIHFDDKESENNYLLIDDDCRKYEKEREKIQFFKNLSVEEQAERTCAELNFNQGE